MNNIAICPNLFMYALQNQNVERKLVKKFDIKHLTREPENDNIVDINISEKDLKTKTETTNNDLKTETETINNVERDLKTETLESTIVSDNNIGEKDLKAEYTNISDIPAILMEPSV